MGVLASKPNLWNFRKRLPGTRLKCAEEAQHPAAHRLDSREVNHVLQLDRVEFPTGIRFNGHYENHLNWDVVKVLRFAWPTLDDTTRDQARAEILRMLNSCLTNSYQPDGSFKVSELDDTQGDAFAYGLRFLRDTGFFRRKHRF